MSKFAQLGIWEATRDGCGIFQPQLLLNKSGTNQEMPRSAVPVPTSRIHATRRSASAAPPVLAPVALPTTALATLATLAPSGTFLALLNDSDSKLKRRSEDDIQSTPPEMRVLRLAASLRGGVVPTKSTARYEKANTKFQELRLLKLGSLTAALSVLSSLSDNIVSTV